MLTKTAQSSPTSAPTDTEFADRLQRIESLRHGALVRNGVQRQTAERAGGRVGLVGGVGTGGIGATLAPLVLKLLSRKAPALAGIPGRLMAASGIGGALGGGFLGHAGGRALGRSAVPELPEFMRSPVTAQSMPQITQHLSKASEDRIRERMKTAGLGQFAGSAWRGLVHTLRGGNASQALRTVRAQAAAAPAAAAPAAAHAPPITRPAVTPQSMAQPTGAQAPLPLPPPPVTPPAAGGGAPPPLTPPATISGGASPGWFFNRRNALIGSGVVAAGAGGNAALNSGVHSADTTPGSSAMNPVTWFNRWGRGNEDAYGAFRNNMAEVAQRRVPLDQQLNAAYASNDTPAMDRLHAQLDSGNYGGGLFSSPASYYQNNALRLQQGVQARHTTEMSRHAAQPGDQDRMVRIRQQLRSSNLLPHQADALQRQLEMLRQRMQHRPGTSNAAADLIRRNMETAGMRFMPYSPAAAASGTAPDYWGMGNRPGAGTVQGHALNPYDHRQSSAWEQALRRDGDSQRNVGP